MRLPSLVFMSALGVACAAPDTSRLNDPSDVDLDSLGSSPAPAPPTQYCARIHQLEHAPFCTWKVDAGTLDQVGGYALSFEQGKLRRACARGMHRAPGYPDSLDCVVYRYVDGHLRRSRGVTRGGRILWETRVSADGTRLDYWDGYGRRRASEEDVFGQRLELDERGRVAVRTYVDSEGQPTPNALGRFQERYTYDDRSEVSELGVLDAHGTPTEDDQGVGIERYSRSSHGALKEERMFSAEGKPVSRDGEYQRHTMRLDELDRVLEEKAFLADGTLARFRTGYSIRRSTYRNRRIDHLYLDASGAPFRIWTGGSRNVTFYDEEYRPRRLEAYHLGHYAEKRGMFSSLDITRQEGYIDRRFYGADEKLMRSRPSHIRHFYSPAGFQVKTEYFDWAGKPTLWVDTARRESKYVDGKLVEERSYGLDGNLLAKGIAVQKYEYDKLGRIRLRRGFDAAGNDLDVVAVRRLTFKIHPKHNDDLEAAKAEALERARAVYERLQDGSLSFSRAFRTYDDARGMESEAKIHVDPMSKLQGSPVHELAIGEYLEPLEWDGAYRIYQRVP